MANQENEVGSDQEKRQPLTIRDRVSITLSICAVLISAVTFYLANIRVSESLDATIVSWGSEHDYVTATTALVNSGNRPAIILSMGYHIASSSPGLVFSDSPKVDVSFPLYIPEGEVRIVSMKIPRSEFARQAGQNDNAVSSLRFSSLDSKGRIYHTVSPKPFLSASFQGQSSRFEKLKDAFEMSFPLFVKGQ
jgi:hypothetical protein